MCKDIIGARFIVAFDIKRDLIIAATDAHENSDTKKYAMFRVTSFSSSPPLRAPGQARCDQRKALCGVRHDAFTLYSNLTSKFESDLTGSLTRQCLRRCGTGSPLSKSASQPFAFFGEKPTSALFSSKSRIPRVWTPDRSNCVWAAG